MCCLIQTLIPRSCQYTKPATKDQHNYICVDGQRIKTQGTIPNRLKKIDWVDTNYVGDEWTFMIPHDTLCHDTGDLWTLDRNSWKLNVTGVSTGFQVKSVQQAMCITKLAYFNMGYQIKGYNDDRRSGTDH